MKTKGATSFLSVSLGDLNALLKPEAQVLVSRKFLQNIRAANLPAPESSPSESKKVAKFE